MRGLKSEEGRKGGKKRHNRGRISHSGLFTNAEKRLEIVSKMSTAALEHLRTGEGRNGCPAGKKKKTKTKQELRKLYVDRVFVCKTCTVKDLL